jgi:peroxiredoxin
MLATLCLMSCALAPGQPASGSQWLLAPRLGRGQELVYRGTYTEESAGRGVQFSRSYRLQARAFVLDSSPQGADVAFLTTLKQQSDRPAPGPAHAAPEPGSVRLEIVRMNPQGRLVADAAAALLVPLNGPATVECGAVVEVSKGRVVVGQKWDVAEEGRPTLTWTVTGTELVNGASCVKLLGQQQSDDWDRPRADRAAWRRTEVVWLSPRLGVAYRVERTVEHREPAHREPSQRIITRYELDNPLVYPGQLFDDRYREIMQYKGFAATAGPLCREPGKYSPKAYEALLFKIDFHLENRPPTPYRVAIQHVRARVEAARTGKAPSAPAAEVNARPTVAVVGRAAPDFVVNGLTGKQPVRLQRLLGRPVLLVFYSPASRSAEELLRFAQGLQDKGGGQLAVLGLAVSDDAAAVLKQHAALKLQFPLAAGKGLRLTYGIEATPKLVVLDADGIVRGAYIGWGPDIPASVVEELKRCQRPKAEEASEPGAGQR